MAGRHLLLEEIAWDEQVARAAIEQIARDAATHFHPERLWPSHPADEWCREGETSLYWGAAGVMLALHDLGLEHGRRDDFLHALPSIRARNRTAVAQFAPLAGFSTEQASYLLGDIGVLLVEMRLAPDTMVADELEARIRVNFSLPTLELMWGTPGTMLACIFLDAMTGEARWRTLYQSQAEKLFADLAETPNGPLWTQTLYGSTVQYLGLVHGLAGHVLALLKGWEWLTPDQQGTTREIASRTLARTAVRFDGGLNWPADARAPTAPELVQICHGAPGIVFAFADARIDTVDLRALLEDGGECIWNAGPLAKGSNVCHGTAGNGYAFLRLHALTGKPLWLGRARLFAMNAIAQWRAAQAQDGRGRYSIWTGDVGLALFLRDCIEGSPRFPSLDTF